MVVEARLVEAPDGVALHVRAAAGGDGVPFLLVHGLASNARLWDGVGAGLAARGHPWAAADLRGHGRSGKPDHGYDHDTIAADLVAVLDSLGWPRAVAVGQSWGGNLAVHLAATRPERLAGVAAVDGGTIDLARRFPTWDACEAALAPPRFDGIPLAEVERHLRRAHADWPETGIQGALANFEVRPDGTVAPWLARDRHLRLLRHLWAHPPGPHFADVTVPVLLLPAVGSPVSPREEVDAAAAALPHVRVRWFEGADHDLHAQHPDVLAALLHEHVRDGFFLEGVAA